MARWSSTTEAEARRVETLRFHGISHLPDRTRDVAFPGGKFNLPDVNARIGHAQIERLPEFLAKRRALVDRYFARFATEPACVLPPRPASADDGHTWNMFCVLLPLERMTIDATGSATRWKRAASATGVSYEALHLCTLGRRFGGREGQHPNAERIARETVTLAAAYRAMQADVDRVCEAAAAIIAAARKIDDGLATAFGGGSRLQRRADAAAAVRAPLSRARQARRQPTK